MHALVTCAGHNQIPGYILESHVKIRYEWQSTKAGGKWKRLMCTFAKAEKLQRNCCQEVNALERELKKCTSAYAQRQRHVSCIWCMNSENFAHLARVCGNLPVWCPEGWTQNNLDDWYQQVVAVVTNIISICNTRLGYSPVGLYPQTQS